MKKRTIYTPNEIVLYDDYAEVIMYNINCIEINRAKIDLEDVDKVKLLKWTMDELYPRNVKSKVRLHRYILDYSGPLSVDHINGNKLDNRKSNLRICTHSNNLKNIKIPIDNKSGIVGVMWDKARGKWRVEIKCNGQRHYGGRFDKIEDAIVKRLELEQSLFGEEFAPQRHLFNQYLNRD